MVTAMVSPTDCLHSVGVNSRVLQTKKKNQSPCCSPGLGEGGSGYKPVHYWRIK